MLKLKVALIAVQQKTLIHLLTGYAGQGLWEPISGNIAYMAMIHAGWDAGSLHCTRTHSHTMSNLANVSLDYGRTPQYLEESCVTEGEHANCTDAEVGFEPFTLEV